jgi:hypothetical protein
MADIMLYGVKIYVKKIVPKACHAIVFILIGVKTTI